VSKSRLPILPVDKLTADQRRLFDNITGGARSKNRPLADFLNEENGLKGPFNAFLYSPEAGDAAQRLGEILRFQSTLPGPLRELAILTVAAHWRAEYEWWAHAKIARTEGLDEATIQAVKAGEPLQKNDGPGVVHGFVRELLNNRRVGGGAFRAARELLGDRGLVELVMLVGYYGLISAALNVFQVPLPDGVAPTFNGEEVSEKE